MSARTAPLSPDVTRAFDRFTRAVVRSTAIFVQAARDVRFNAPIVLTATSAYETIRAELNLLDVPVDDRDHLAEVLTRSLLRETRDVERDEHPTH